MCFWFKFSKKKKKKFPFQNWFCLFLRIKISWFLKKFLFKFVVRIDSFLFISFKKNKYWKIFEWKIEIKNDYIKKKWKIHLKWKKVFLSSYIIWNGNLIQLNLRNLDFKVERRKQHRFSWWKEIFEPIFGNLGGQPSSKNQSTKKNFGAQMGWNDDLSTRKHHPKYFSWH